MDESVLRVLARSLNSTWVEYEFLRWRCGKKLKRGRVHDFRTSIRRLCAILDLLCDLDRGARAPAKLRRAVHRELSAVRELRDLQVQERRAGGDSRLCGLFARIQRRKRRAKREARDALGRRRLERNRCWLFRVERELLDLRADQRALSGAIGRIYAQVQEAARGIDPGNLSTFHCFRVRLRRYRYTCEAVEEFGFFSAEAERVCGELQGDLGDLQDLVVLKGMLKKREAEFGARLDREIGAVVGRILRGCERRVAGIRPKSSQIQRVKP